MAYTDQELFDKIANHLLTQNAKSRNLINEKNIGCVYFDPETGRKCAVGCLFDAETYNPAMENSAVGNLFSDSTLSNSTKSTALKTALNKVGIKQEQYHLLKALQNLHDGCDVENWKRELAEVALAYNLNTDAII